MRTKVIDVRSDMQAAARQLENNEFWGIPQTLIPQFGNVVPVSQQPHLMSATIGVSGSHFFVVTHREDLRDAPETVNTEVSLFGYDLSTRVIRPKGLLVYRGGQGWHHLPPSDDYADGVTFDDVSLTGAPFEISGVRLSDPVKKAVADCLNVKQVKFPKL